MKYVYTIEDGITPIQSSIKKYIVAATVSLIAVGAMAIPAIGAKPDRPVTPLSVAAVFNENANSNSCWGQDRAYYTSGKFFPENQSINQSFPGDVGEQRAAWVATYCEQHGPVAE